MSNSPRLPCAIGIVVIALLTGCISNKEVRKVQAGDSMKSCDDLKSELVDLGVAFEDVKRDSGLTAENAVSFLVFWPGIIYNEVRASKNTNSVNKRINFLSALYNQKCRGDQPSRNEKAESSVRERLEALKRLLNDGLINEAQYNTRVDGILSEI